jgi:tetratricopeptide (TPR) repeat protein
MDREDILWKAEKLVRQGRLNLAITEYKRVVDEYPEDWATANTLGDLYLRAQQIDKAVEQYSRIADHLAQEGFLPKANALYKKTLKIKPGYEHAMLQAADIAMRQGLLAEARQYFSQLAATRRASGNLAGAAEALMRISALDPDDLDARLTATRAAAEAGQREIAAAEFLNVADELDARGRTGEAIEVLEEAGRTAPENRSIGARLIRACAESGDAQRARKHAMTVDDFRELARIFDARGDTSAMLECLHDVVRLDSTDADAAALLVRDYVTRGHLTTAHQYLPLARETSDPDLLLVVGEVHARLGETDAAREVMTRLLARAPHAVSSVVDLGVRLAEALPEAGLACVEAAAGIHVLRGEFKAAAEGYERLLDSQPSNLTALMCLVELCMEGGLDGDLVSSQSRLVDAYLAHDRALEARAVAEDLAVRTRDPLQIERFRRALEATGEPDPDAIVAERLGITIADETPDPQAQVHAPIETPPAPASASATLDAGASAAPPRQDVDRPEPAAPGGVGADPFRLGPIAIDLGDILGESVENEPAAPPANSPHVEGELTEKPKKARSKSEPAAPAAGAPARTAPAGEGGSRPEEFFSDFHEEVARQTDAELAEQHYKVGVTYRDMGMVPEAIAELELAVRSPRFRFDAAALLGRLNLQRGEVAAAIEWFERAAEAPAPSADAARGLLYELGDALEISGESARALAVFMELLADAGDYRDVSRRVERLSRVQTGG